MPHFNPYERISELTEALKRVNSLHSPDPDFPDQCTGCCVPDLADSVPGIAIPSPYPCATKLAMGDV